MNKEHQCNGCKHLDYPHDGLWCYMFKEEPTFECKQHSKFDGLRRAMPKGLLLLNALAQIESESHGNPVEEYFKNEENKKNPHQYRERKRRD